MGSREGSLRGVDGQCGVDAQDVSAIGGIAGVLVRHPRPAAERSLRCFVRPQIDDRRPDRLAIGAKAVQRELPEVA
jgi:hypothetical protein